MTEARWAQVKALFQAAVDRPASERADFLAAAAGGNERLRREVESLLRSDDPDAALTNLLQAQAASPNRVSIETNDVAVGANPDAKDAKGRTALHRMLAKGMDTHVFHLFARHGARGDVPDAGGRTAADIMRRKRAPAFHRIAARLASGSGARRAPRER